MQEPITTYRKQLRPLLEMLQMKRMHLSKEAWADTVNETRNSVLGSPVEYLQLPGTESPSNELINQTFDEFLKESNNFWPHE